MFVAHQKRERYPPFTPTKEKGRRAVRKVKKKVKPRDEVMLLHLLKTFNCGFHANRKKYNRQEENRKMEKISEEY